MRDLAGAYERTALRWEELQAQPADANKVFDENHSIYKQLREHEVGLRRPWRRSKEKAASSH